MPIYKGHPVPFFLRPEIGFHHRIPAQPVFLRRQVPVTAAVEIVGLADHKNRQLRLTFPDCLQKRPVGGTQILQRIGVVIVVIDKRRHRLFSDPSGNLLLPFSVP